MAFIPSNCEFSAIAAEIEEARVSFLPPVIPRRIRYTSKSRNKSRGSVNVAGHRPRGFRDSLGVPPRYFATAIGASVARSRRHLAFRVLLITFHRRRSGVVPQSNDEGEHLDSRQGNARQT